ncbi:hypothetical protein NQD34_011104 [Periophthalmus magnuspinnatus]|uniref:GTPase IMAP family member 8-like n=1 Tax=Periophthalmus magnuspinnatus TaxID=409849 RepID=UPI0022C6C573|nr:GTPase IMAP family member 8-like [Periophthalmus magnuspinnatus]KAJ0004890.1 hypothetical protein NQD34_011104 [Periophthalmus magnuspinnatus]
MDAEGFDDSELRLVLVGSQRFGTNAVASSLLGLEGSSAQDWGRRTARSVTRSAEVEGKRVRLVKAPAWLRSYHLQDTAELVRQELVLSLSHTRPGPHAFILLCEVDLPFTSACARAVTAHLSLLGPHVWTHSLLLFTCGDWLGHSSLEDYLKGEGIYLAQLLDRCGHRYLMDNTSTPDLSRRVLTKVQELLNANGGQHFHIEEDRIQRIVQSREEVKRRAERRRKRRKKSEEGTRAKDCSLSEITVVLLGWVFAVKTKVRRALLRDLEQEGRTMKCTKASVDLSEHLKLTVVDTPGWWKYFSPSLVPQHVRAEILKAFRAYQEAGGRSTQGRAVFLMIPADTSFTQEQLKIIRDNMRPLGEQIWRRTILVFTRGHWLGEFTIEQHIESEGEALVWLVEQCGNRYFVFDGDAEQSGLETQGHQLIQMVLDLCESGPDPHQNPGPKTVQEPTEELEEEPVDEDLQKMVGVLHKVWAWGSWEIEELAARFFERPLYEFADVASMHLTNMFKGSSDLNLIRQPREEVEKILREEMRGKSLEEVVEAALQIYFRKEVGAFDIVSIICEKDQFKPEWKSLFEREWARREVRLKEYVFNSYVRAGADEARRLIESHNKVSAWLDAMPPSIEDLVKIITLKLQSLVSQSVKSVTRSSSPHGFVTM